MNSLFTQTFRGDFLRYPLVNSTAFRDSIRDAVSDILGAPKGSIMNYFNSEDCRFPSTGVYRCILIVYSTNKNYASTITKIATAFQTDPKFSIDSRLVSLSNDYASLISASVGVPVTVTSYQIANPTFSPTGAPAGASSLLRNRMISKGPSVTLYHRIVICLFFNPCVLVSFYTVPCPQLSFSFIAFTLNVSYSSHLKSSYLIAI